MSSSPLKSRHVRKNSNTEKELHQIIMKERELRQIIRGEKEETKLAYGAQIMSVFVLYIDDLKTYPWFRRAEGGKTCPIAIPSQQKSAFEQSHYPPIPHIAPYDRERLASLPSIPEDIGALSEGPD